MMQEVLEPNLLICEIPVSSVHRSNNDSALEESLFFQHRKACTRHSWRAIPSLSPCTRATGSCDVAEICYRRSFCPLSAAHSTCGVRFQVFILPAHRRNVPLFVSSWILSFPRIKAPANNPYEPSIGVRRDVSTPFSSRFRGPFLDAMALVLLRQASRSPKEIDPVGCSRG